jgi:general secretion pathway protein E
VPVTSEHEDRTFASMGIASLRMDPDVIVLGEMRDLATAVVMTRAALTGHLVFSTLHTNTSVGIVTRLVDMGISQNLLADPDMLVCLIAQRLVPILCTNCAKSIANSKVHQAHLSRWKQVLGADMDNIKVRGHDCDVCKGLGVIGRTVAAEIVWIDELGRRFIKQCDILGWEKYLRDNGWRSYRDHVLDLVKSGRCDPLDAERIVGTITPAFTASTFDYRKTSFD